MLRYQGQQPALPVQCAFPHAQPRNSTGLRLQKNNRKLKSEIYTRLLTIGPHWQLPKQAGICIRPTTYIQQYSITTAAPIRLLQRFLLVWAFCYVYSRVPRGTRYRDELLHCMRVAGGIVHFGFAVLLAIS